MSLTWMRQNALAAIELRKSSVSMHEVIEQAVGISTPKIERRQHTLRVEVSPEPMIVAADSVRLVQVVANLLNNRLLGDADLRLVALTGFGQAAHKRRATEVGFNLHLVKPATPDALKRALAI